MRKLGNYIEKWYSKFGDYSEYDLSKVNYVNKRTKIQIIHKKYGSFWVFPESFMKCGRVNVDYNNNRTNRKYKYEDITKGLVKLKLTPLQDYKSSSDCILVKSKYGVCKVRCLDIIKGITPTISTSINKTEYFINQAKEVHNDKYDYSLVVYINSKNKVKIIGDFGVFEQTPVNHLRGSGCRKEADKQHSSRMGEKGALWSSTQWNLAGNNSKNFNKYKVYIIECEYKNERFFKIGKTFTDINKRFNSKDKMPYTFNIISIKLFDTADECSIYEKMLHKENKKEKYTPTLKFKGCTECFTTVNIPELNVYIN